MDVTYNVMHDAFTFVSINMSIYFEYVGNCWDETMQVLEEDHWGGFDIYYTRKISYLPRLIWNLGDATFTNVNIYSDWDKDELLGMMWDFIENYGDCTEAGINATLNHHYHTGCGGDGFRYLESGLRFLCEYYNNMSRYEFIDELPLVFIHPFSGDFAGAMFYNDASGM